MEEKPTATAHFLFPTVVYRDTVKDHESIDRTFRENLSSYEFDVSNDIVTGEYAGKIDLHHNPIFAPFFAALKKAVGEYLDILGVNEDLFDTYVTKTWLSVIEKPDQNIRSHSHSMSDISFVYYLEIPKNAQALWFVNNHRPNELFEGMMDHYRPRHDITMLKEVNVANQNLTYFNPEPGMLILFPGKLMHYTDDSPDAYGPMLGRRVALAGDINLYLKPGLNNFESGRIAVDFMRKL